MAKLLIIIGLVIAGTGLAMALGLPLGRLPGDFVYRKGSFTFYFPLTTAVVLSVLLTLLLAFLRR
jgi:predicted MFS family arabinose efflux permease